MISAVFLALVLVLPALTTRPALAVTFAECQAFLCLPGGFPPSECNAAKAAVLARLAALKPALPPWSSCAAQFGWDSANLSHTEPRHEECVAGDTLTNGQCHGTDANGCHYSYVSREIVTVQVVVDGTTNFQPNHTLTHTTRSAGTPNVDTTTCDTPPPVIVRRECATPGPYPPGATPPAYYRITTGCPCEIPGYLNPWPPPPDQKYCTPYPGVPVN